MARAGAVMHRILLHHSGLPAAADPAQVAAWIEALPAGKGARVGRMRAPQRRLATVLGIALLRDCARAAGIEPPMPSVLCFPEQGKPRWPGGPDFSISHAAGRVACALAPAGVGVGLDIEAAGAAEAAVLRLVVAGPELADHVRAGLTPTDLWAAKEAVVKLTGAGITGAGRVAVSVSTARDGDGSYVISRPAVAAGCCCAVASTHPLPVDVRERPAAEVLAALP